MLILNGLPPGSELRLRGPLENFTNQVHMPGGSLGGGIDVFAAKFTWLVSGTGDLAGFQRNIVMPLSAEVHTGPRNPGDPVQVFDKVLISSLVLIRGKNISCSFMHLRNILVIFRYIYYRSE